MSSAAPAGASCATHPQVAAAWTCGRCGAFFCVECERRTRPDALPMCPGCWELRKKAVVPQPVGLQAPLQSAALALGVVALVPGCWWGQLLGVGVGVVALLRSRQGPDRPYRWRAVVGLVLSVLGALGWLLLWSQART